VKFLIVFVAPASSLPIILYHTSPRGVLDGQIGLFYPSTFVFRCHLSFHQNSVLFISIVYHRRYTGCRKMGYRPSRCTALIYTSTIFPSTQSKNYASWDTSYFHVLPRRDDVLDPHTCQHNSQLFFSLPNIPDFTRICRQVFSTRFWNTTAS